MSLRKVERHCIMRRTSLDFSASETRRAEKPRLTAVSRRKETFKMTRIALGELEEAFRSPRNLLGWKRMSLFLEPISCVLRVLDFILLRDQGRETAH